MLLQRMHGVFSGERVELYVRGNREPAGVGDLRRAMRPSAPRRAVS